MHRYIVVRNPDTPKDVFVEWLSSIGTIVKDYTGLVDFYEITTEWSETELEAHKYVKAADPYDAPSYNALSVAHNGDFTDTTNGNYAASRVLSRLNPFQDAGLMYKMKYSQTVSISPTETGSGVDAYICDTGIDTDHSEFSGASITSITSTAYTSIEDDHGHGSAGAACLGGATAGVAPGVDFRISKCFNSSNVGFATDIVTSIDASVTDYNGRNRPAVLNLSIQSSSSTVTAAMEAAVNAGLVTVGAAGNQGDDLATATFDAVHNADGVVCVGASTMQDAPANFSNWGAGIDIWAPGKDICTATFGGGFRVWNGTSFSSPTIAGVLALMLQGKSKLTDKAGVDALVADLYNNATTGIMIPGYANTTDKLGYYPN